MKERRTSRDCGGKNQKMTGKKDDIFPQRCHLLLEARTPHDREVLQRQIDVTDRQIDQLVYKLYDLTEGGSA